LLTGLPLSEALARHNLDQRAVQSILVAEHEGACLTDSVGQLTCCAQHRAEPASCPNGKAGRRPRALCRVTFLRFPASGLVELDRPERTTSLFSKFHGGSAW
jgi:hypothetical protein